MSVTAERLVFPLGAALAALAVFVNALGVNGILVFSLPSVTLAAGVCFAAAVCGLVPSVLFSRGQMSRPRRAAFAVSVAVMVLAFVDIGWGGHALTSAVGAQRWVRILVLLVALAGAAVMVDLLRLHASRLLLIVASTLMVVTLATNSAVVAWHEPPVPQYNAANEDMPPFVYIVLDSAMGIEGMKTVEGAAPLADRLTNLLIRHGFRVYGQAYSRHFTSARSIPNTLNGDHGDDSWGPVVRHQAGGAVTSSIFQRLASDGYEIVSFKTRHIDFCFAEASRCEALPSFDPATPLMSSRLTVRIAALAKILWDTYNRSYVLYGVRRPVFNAVALAGWPPMVSFVDTHASPGWFDYVAGSVLSGGRGRAYFAHIMAPHAPFVLRPDCTERAVPVTADFLVEVRQLAGEELEAARAQGYRAYLDQYECVEARLEGFLKQLSDRPEFRDAVVVVHGDHGSRISAGQYAETVSDRDLIDNYSALYAIRRPDIKEGYDLTSTSIQQLSADIFMPERSSHERTETVVLDSVEPGRVMLRPMVPFQ